MIYRLRSLSPNAQRYLRTLRSRTFRSRSKFRSSFIVGLGHSSITILTPICGTGSHRFHRSGRRHSVCIARRDARSSRSSVSATDDTSSCRNAHCTTDLTVASVSDGFRTLVGICSSRSSRLSRIRFSSSRRRPGRKGSGMRREIIRRTLSRFLTHRGRCVHPAITRHGGNTITLLSRVHHRVKPIPRSCLSHLIASSRRISVRSP